MQVDLNKEDLVSLVCGKSPSYKAMDQKLIKRCGRFDGSKDRWDWDKSELKTLLEIELFTMYNYLKTN